MGNARKTGKETTGRGIPKVVESRGRNRKTYTTLHNILQSKTYKEAKTNKMVLIEER